ERPEQTLGPLAQPRVAGDAHRRRGAAPPRILLPQPAMGEPGAGHAMVPDGKDSRAAALDELLDQGPRDVAVNLVVCAREPRRVGDDGVPGLVQMPVLSEKVRLARLDDDGIASLGEDAGQRS